MGNDICQKTVDYLNYVIDFLPDIIFAIDLDGKVIAWNKQMEIFAGKRKTDVMGLGREAYSTPFYGYDRKLLIDLVFSEDTETENTYDKFCRKGDGTVEGYIYIPYLNRYMWGMASPIKDAEGDIIGAVESIRDVTDVVDTRKMVNLSSKLIDHIPELVWAKDINNRYLFANKKFMDVLQISDKDIRGIKSSDLFGETKFEVSDDRVKELGTQEYVDSVKIPTGETIWLKICKMPFFDDKNRLIGTIGSARDITKKIKITEERDVEINRLKKTVEEEIESWKKENEEKHKELSIKISQSITILKNLQLSNGVITPLESKKEELIF